LHIINRVHFQMVKILLGLVVLAILQHLDLLENLESIRLFFESWENGRSNKMINSLRTRILIIFFQVNQLIVEYLEIDRLLQQYRQEFGNIL
jgi:hypothetical protein